MSSSAIEGLDISVFEAVLESGGEKRRFDLAMQLAQFTSNPETPDHELEQIAPILLQLSMDECRDVRMTLAQGIGAEGRVAADVAFSIVADDDDIALPFLAQTQAFDSQQLIAILKVGDEIRQCTIANREDLEPEVVEYIVKAGCLQSAIAMFDTHADRLEPSELHMLYARFGQSQDMVERLLERADLPLDVRIIQARRAASRMRQMMAEKGWLAANDASEICSEAEDNAVTRVLLGATEQERELAMAFMASKNMLTPAFIVRAAARGQMTVVEAALAHLTGQSQKRAAIQMYDMGGAFKSVFRKSGLPVGCQGILRAACDVMIDVREEGISISPAEFGGRLLEALMTRYEAMSSTERAKQIEYLGRYGEDKIRKVAKRVKADFVRAA